MSFTLHSYGIFHLTLFKKFVMSLEKDYFDHVVLSFLAFFTINSDIKTWDTNYSKSSIHSRRTNILILFNPLVPIVACLYSLKTSENLWFSHVFRGYKKAALGTNGLINIWKKQNWQNSISPCRAGPLAHVHMENFQMESQISPRQASSLLIWTYYIFIGVS